MPKKNTQKITTVPTVVLETQAVQTKELAPLSGFTPSMTPEFLTAMVDNETALRKVLEKYIRANMQDKIDFDRIHIAKKDKCPNKWDCTYKKNPGHYSKPTLLKPGAEKFSSLFKLTVRFRKDNETWEMAGQERGLFCYVCELVDLNGKVVAEGRGSCSTLEKDNANTAIKIAQKRAQMDATLRYGSLSGVFAQDLEDMPIEQIQAETSPAKPVAAKPAGNPGAPDFPKCMTMVKGLNNETAIFDAVERVKKSKFTAAQKQELQAVLSRRLDEIHSTTK